MVKGKPVVHDESDIRVTDKFDEERLHHREQYPRCIQGGHLLQMGPLLSYLEKDQDRVPGLI